MKKINFSKDDIMWACEHYYPIPRKSRGTETVNICPNCYYGFHCLENLLGEDK